MRYYQASYDDAPIGDPARRLGVKSENVEEAFYLIRQRHGAEPSRVTPRVTVPGLHKSAVWRRDGPSLNRDGVIVYSKAPRFKRIAYAINFTRHGAEHYAAIGKVGGKKLAQERGPEWYAQIGRKGGAAPQKPAPAPEIKKPTGDKGRERLRELTTPPEGDNQ